MSILSSSLVRHWLLIVVCVVSASAVAEYAMLPVRGEANSITGSRQFVFFKVARARHLDKIRDSFHSMRGYADANDGGGGGGGDGDASATLNASIYAVDDAHTVVAIPLHIRDLQSRKQGAAGTRRRSSSTAVATIDNTTTTTTTTTSTTLSTTLVGVAMTSRTRARKKTTKSSPRTTATTTTTAWPTRVAYFIPPFEMSDNNKNNKGAGDKRLGANFLPLGSVLKSTSSRSHSLSLSLSFSLSRIISSFSFYSFSDCCWFIN